MPYLTYNGKLVINDGGKFLNNLPDPGLQVVDFDGQSAIILDEGGPTSTIPDLDTTSGSIAFKLYLDKDSGFSDNRLYNLKKSSQKMAAILDGSTLYFQGFSFVTGLKSKSVDITGRDGEILEVVAQYSNDDISSVTINNVSQTLGTDTASSSTGGKSSIGANGTETNQPLEDATIWDVRTYTGASSLNHRWIGTGASANQDSAWEDQVGSKDMTVVGDPSIRSL